MAGPADLPDIDTCQAAVVAAFPNLADARFTPLHAGWDSLALDVDDALIFKFPRGAEGEYGLRREAALLNVLRPRLTMAVPDMAILPGPPLFSRHAKLPGEHLLPPDYARLEEAARADLAAQMARFHAEMHALSDLSIAAVGDDPVEPWTPADEMRERGVPTLPPHLRDRAMAAIAGYVALPPDPTGQVLGYFDGHGWNMAFDHDRLRLNGIFDFADAGVGGRHEEFAYASFVSPDLSERIMRDYEMLTGVAIDRHRVATLTWMVHLSDCAEYADDPETLVKVLDYAVPWFEQQTV